MRHRQRITWFLAALLAAPSCGDDAGGGTDAAPEPARVSPDDWNGVYAVTFTCVTDCQNSPLTLAWFGDAQIVIEDNGEGLFCDWGDVGGGEGWFARTDATLVDGVIHVAELELDAYTWLDEMALIGTDAGFTADVTVLFYIDNPPRISEWTLVGTKTST